MASRSHMKHLLILVLVVIFALMSVASTAHASSSYKSYGSTHVDDDDDEAGYGHKEESGGKHGKSPMKNDDDDDCDDKQGYGKPAHKKDDDPKGVYDKPKYKKGEDGKSKNSYGKPKKDDDDDFKNKHTGGYEKPEDDHDHEHTGGYEKPEEDDDHDHDREHTGGYEKPKNDDDDDHEHDGYEKRENDDDDSEHGDGYDKPSKGGYQKPTKAKSDDKNLGRKDKPKNGDHADEYKGKGPKKEDKKYPYGGDDEPVEGPKPDSHPSEVVPVSISVEGVVSCQDCKYVGSESLTNSKPIAGAKVKLACQAGPRRKSFFYATATTDAHGFFLISVPHFDFYTYSPVEDCVVFLVSSPLQKCSTVTDINKGKNGGPLRPIPTFAPSSNLMYSVGPFAFAPKWCSSKPQLYSPPPSPMHKPGQQSPPYDGETHY